MSEEVPVPTVFVPLNDEVTVEIRNSYINYGYNPAVEYTEEELDELIELEVKSLRMRRGDFAAYVD